MIGQSFILVFLKKKTDQQEKRLAGTNSTKNETKRTMFFYDDHLRVTHLGNMIDPSV
jgi:hypothetical protein